MRIGQVEGWHKLRDIGIQRVIRVGINATQVETERRQTVLFSKLVKRQRVVAESDRAHQVEDLLAQFYTVNLSNGSSGTVKWALAYGLQYALAIEI